MINGDFNGDLTTLNGDLWGFIGDIMEGDIMDNTLWLFNIAMEHGPFIDGLPINSMVIFHGNVK